MPIVSKTFLHVSLLLPNTDLTENNIGGRSDPHARDGNVGSYIYTLYIYTLYNVDVIMYIV